MNHRQLRNLGWQRDLPDFRDFSDEHENVKKVLAKSTQLKTAKEIRPQRSICARTVPPSKIREIWDPAPPMPEWE
jgi:hypothetical protein